MAVKSKPCPELGRILRISSARFPRFCFALARHLQLQVAHLRTQKLVSSMLRFVEVGTFRRRSPKTDVAPCSALDL